MLRSMRKHRSKVLGFLVVIIIVVFVFAFGFSGKGQNDKTVAQIGSHKITAMEYYRTYDRVLESMRSQGRKDIDEERGKLKEGVMNSLVDKYLLLNKAAEMGIAVSDREFDESVRTAGVFNDKDGKFNRQLYLDYVSRTGVDLKTFEENQKQAMVMQRMIAIIVDNGTAAMDEKAAYESYMKQRGQVKLSVAVFDPDEYKGKVSLDDKELDSLYEREKSAHRSENTFHLKYVVIDEKSGVRDDQVYMDLLKSKDLTAYGQAKGLEVADLGTLKESEVLSRFGKLKIQEALKGLAKGDVTLPLRAENKSFIFQVTEREDGKLLDKNDALKQIRARVVAEKARAMARLNAEDAIKSKSVKYTKDTGFVPRGTNAVPGVGTIPPEGAGLLALSRGETFQRPVEVNGKFYVFAYADEKQPDKDEWAKTKDMFTSLNAQIMKEAFYSAFKDQLRKDADVKINWTAI